MGETSKENFASDLILCSRSRGETRRNLMCQAVQEATTWCWKQGYTEHNSSTRSCFISKIWIVWTGSELRRGLDHKGLDKPSWIHGDLNRMVNSNSQWSCCWHLRGVSKCIFNQADLCGCTVFHHSGGSLPAFTFNGSFQVLSVELVEPPQPWPAMTTPPLAAQPIPAHQPEIR